jgi:hypothetical protein
MLHGNLPNTGRFCGECYTPIATGREVCPHCNIDTKQIAPIEHLPLGIIDVYIARRKQEGLAVKLTFYTVLLIGIIISALVIGFLPFWWNVAAFTVALGASYLLSANLANTFGDSVGYRWGQRAAEKKWQQILLEEQQEVKR